tara:strand:+ start:5901 stop:6149 length:249 start_codon:yes stop_codon:yes gene_type:complete
MNAKKAKLLRKLTGYTSANSDTVVKYEAVDGTVRPRYVPVYTTQADGTLEVTQKLGTTTATLQQVPCSANLYKRTKKVFDMF